jgi:hypothetical protein
LVVASLLLLLAVAVRLIFLEPNPRVTEADFERNKKGMRQEDVEAIFGPPGDYRTAPAYYSPPPLGSRAIIWDWPKWQGDEAAIWVAINSDGLVVYPLWILADHPGISVLDWLMWRWERWQNCRAP